MRTPRSPFARSARKSAAVPGAPEAVTRTVRSRIAARCYSGAGAGEEEPDAVPAGDLAAVLPAEVRPDYSPTNPTRDERLLRPAVDLRAGRALRGRRERIGEPGELRAGRGPVRQGARRRPAAQRVTAFGGLVGTVRPDGDVQRGRGHEDCG